MSRIPNRQVNTTFTHERRADSQAPSSSSRASNLCTPHLSPPLITHRLFNQSRQRAPSTTTAPQPAALPTNPLSPSRLTTLKSILDRLLHDCQTPYTRDPYDTDLHALCLLDCAKKGYPIGKGPNLVNPDRYLACGVIIASGAYRHLPRHLQVYIAVYTAFATWMDDVYSDDLAGVDVFYPRFLSGQRQASPGLDAMARIIREVPGLYGETSAQGSIIVMATLRFVSGTLLEYEGKHAKMTSSSRGFSTYLRSFTGIAEAYTMFIFPPGMNIRNYMQAVPDLCHYINHYNDMLSFYKEEKANETNNYISLEAAVLGEDKLVTLARLGRQVAASSQRAIEILETPEAVKAVETFKKGYLTFHTSLESRYLLRDLFRS